MRNEIIKDETGHDNAMVTFTAEELAEILGSDHPVLTVRGRKISELCIGKYQASMVDGVPCSIKGMKPATDINFDDAVAACERKGEGWHLMTAAEWGAIALISKKLGTLPHGNNNSGKDYNHPDEHGELYDGCRVLTGSVPATWSHDHTEAGIYDLNGNVFEWIGGVRFVDGELQLIPDNNAALHADQSDRSKEWQPIETGDGTIKYRVDGSEITVTNEELEDHDWDGCEFKDLKADIEVPKILKQLALFPDGEHDGSDYFYLDNTGERLVSRGGRWNSTSYAGVFCASGYFPRSYASTGIGFRPAFIRFSEICPSDHLTEKETTPADTAQKKETSKQPTVDELIRDLTVSAIESTIRTVGLEPAEGLREELMRSTPEQLTKAVNELPAYITAYKILKALADIPKGVPGDA
jgi:hypothetical protein